ncbi:MAG: PRTRC system protein C [Chloroflexota bacterium]|nr:PRTRC system protein C [Chloroflexota bacterium]
MRVFVYDGRRYPDNHPDKTVDEVRQFLANYFPELSNATVTESRDGDDTVHTFQRRVGTKGAARG